MFCNGLESFNVFISVLYPVQRRIPSLEKTRQETFWFKLSFATEVLKPMLFISSWNLIQLAWIRKGQVQVHFDPVPISIVPHLHTQNVALY